MSLKGDALAKFAPSALGMVAEFTSNIKPDNEVAQFIDENIGILSKTQNDDESDVAHGLLQKLSVAEANNDPEFSLSKLLAFYEQFRVWYVEYTKLDNWNVEDSVNEGEGEAEDTTEDTYVPPLNIDLTKNDATDTE